MNLRLKRGFSLVELLLVLTVVVMLLSLLQPSLNKALEFSKSTHCASKLKSISLTMSVYASDYNNKFPFVYGAYNESLPFTQFNYSSYTWDDFLGREHDGRDLSDEVAKRSHVRPSQVGKSQLVENLYGCPSDDQGDRDLAENQDFIPRSYAMNTYRAGYAQPAPNSGLSGGHQQFTRSGKFKYYDKMWSKYMHDISVHNQTIMLAEVPTIGIVGRMSASGASSASQLYLWGRKSMGDLENREYHFGGYNYAMCDGSVVNMLVTETELNGARLWQTSP